MKKNKFLQNAIILQLVLAIVLGIAFLLFFRANASIVLPVSQGTVFAYHDSRAESESKTDTSNLQPNDIIGTLTVDKTTLSIKYDADYSQIGGGVSFVSSGDNIGDLGCAYLKTYYANVKGLNKKSALKIDGAYGSHTYEYVKSCTANSEYDVFKDSYNAQRGLAIYYQEPSGAGLTSKYKILVYKEVD